MNKDIHRLAEACHAAAKVHIVRSLNSQRVYSADKQLLAAAERSLHA